MMAELRGNKAIEDAAIAWVTELERSAGREPTDSRHCRAPADIESPPRLIEVKAFGTTGRGNDLWLEVRQVEEAKRNPRFYVYVVENVRQGDPARFTLKVLGEDLLARLLGRAKEQRYFTVPWPVADYDSAPTSVGQSPSPQSSDGAAQPASEPHLDGALDPEEGRSSAPPTSTASGFEVVEFRGDDHGYLVWTEAHKGGWVVNANRDAKSSYLQLHKAWCPTISDPRREGAYTERDYIKFCATRKRDLDAYLEALLGARPRWNCTQCG